MNLVEELSENLCSKLCPEWDTCKHEPNYCPEITNKAKHLLPIFAEFIKGKLELCLHEAQSENCFIKYNIVKEFCDTILSELEKMK